MDAVAREQWALALLTARFDCAQQEFFQAEYRRHRRSPAVALALCLTLGAFGAHEFYLGRLRSAALRLLFCWTLIPLLLALAEASFLTRRTHAYNTRMAHALADIITETFAAVREHDRAEERAAAATQAGERAAWQVGAARTFEPPEGALQRQEAGPTMPLAEEREAPPIPPSAPDQPRVLRTAPVTIPLGEPAPVYPTTISRRMRARLDPSLDALLAELTASGESVPESAPESLATPLADQTPASEPAPAPEAAPEAPATLTVAATPFAPVDALEQPELAAPSEPAVTAATPEEPVAQAEAQGEAREEAGDYAKMMATDEPLAGIMGAEPASGPAATSPRIQHIVVRKVALVDGRPVAEAQAMRDVVIRGSDDEVEAQIAAATDEARAEAMSLLAAMVPSETLAQAQGL